MREPRAEEDSALLVLGPVGGPESHLLRASVSKITKNRQEWSILPEGLSEEGLRTCRYTGRHTTGKMSVLWGITQWFWPPPGLCLQPGAFAAHVSECLVGQEEG